MVSTCFVRPDVQRRRIAAVRLLLSDSGRLSFLRPLSLPPPILLALTVGLPLPLLPFVLFVLLLLFPPLLLRRVLLPLRLFLFVLLYVSFNLLSLVPLLFRVHMLAMQTLLSRLWRTGTERTSSTASPEIDLSLRSLAL